MWSQQAEGDDLVVSGSPAAQPASSSAAAVLSYDVAHSIPWDWRVSLYTLTKGIAAGAYLVPMLLVLLGQLPADSPLWVWAAPIVGGAFLALTGLILIWDLEHPERFFYIFTRPQWRSWLVKGGFIIAGYGAVLALHFVASWTGWHEGHRLLIGFGLPLATLTAVYTAWLFAQAKARDLWQSPLLPPHLWIQALVAGAAALALVAMAVDASAVAPLLWTLAAAGLAHLLCVWGESTLPHVTAHARLAHHEMVRGRYGSYFRAGIVLVTVALLAPWVTPLLAIPALLGLLAHEHAYVQAGQSVSLSLRRWRRWVSKTSTVASAPPEPKPRLAARPSTPAPGRVHHLAAFPPKERWDDWVELDAKAWPERKERRYMLVPTTCFNCESACGLLAYVDRDTMEVRKLEGNPEHPGSRGRNCAKGPATLNQITDPDRILHPLKRSAGRGEGRWQRVSWDEALDDIAGRIREAMLEERHNEIMYHVGRPGEDGFTERTMAAWGVDGHNSHTNICSAGARAGYELWCGIDRPSPDHAHAEVILLISSHLETGHYFNPHAQRIIEAKHRGAKVIVLDTRLSNTATHADFWLATQPGSEAAVMLAIANHLIQERPLRPRLCSPLVELGRIFGRHPSRSRADLRELRQDAQGRVRGLHLRDGGSRVRGRCRHPSAGGRGGGHRRHPALHPQLALRRRRQQGRLAGRPHPLLPELPDRLGGDPRRHLPQRLEQIRRPPDPSAAPPRALERAQLAGRVSALDVRAVLPPTPPLEGWPRPPRGLLHPRLQPGVDQSRRLLLDRDAARRDPGSACTWRSPPPGTRPPTSPITYCRWASAPSVTTSTLMRPTTPNGSASDNRSCGPPGSASARRSPTPARPIRARCGKRTNSGWS